MSYFYRRAQLRKYSEDQPRDDRGRWTGGSGGKLSDDEAKQMERELRAHIDGPAPTTSPAQELANRLDRDMGRDRYDPEYVNQDDWQLSNKQPDPEEMRQHGEEMRALVHAGDKGKITALMGALSRTWGRSYAEVVRDTAVADVEDPARERITQALDAAARLLAAQKRK